MTAPLNVDPTLQAAPTGYAGRPVTKPPNWHGLVAVDLLFNNLSTGLFLATALGELLAPASYRPLASVAYPIALLFLIGDLICLVLDLGDPSRCHHMLRVWKPSSPMSFGTWVLSAYALPLTALSAMSLLHAGGGGLDALRRVIIVIGAILALGAAAYKGVLFSTTAQRGWGEARWLGGYLVNSALMLGAAELLLLATVMGQPQVVDPLRLAARLLLLLNLVALGLLVADVRVSLLRVRGPRALASLGTLAVVGGIVVPLLLLSGGAPLQVSAALCFMLMGVAVVRLEIVQLPHRQAAAPAPVKPASS